jgi:hypothetical protein
MTPLQALNNAATMKLVRTVLIITRSPHDGSGR